MGGGGGPGGHGCRRYGHRGAELGHKTDRRGEGELDGGLTSGGRQRQRPESLVNRGGAVWTARTAARRLAGARAGAAVQHGRRRAGSQGLGKTQCLARLALYRGLAPVRGLAAMDVLAVPAMDTGQRLGPDGLHTGALVGPDEMGRAFGLGPVEFYLF
jgi:hypothetical protein